MDAALVIPNLPFDLPTGVHVVHTQRTGGISPSPWGAAPGVGGGFNLGLNTGDEAARVWVHRRHLETLTGGVPVAWMRQVHGASVHVVTAPPTGNPTHAQAGASPDEPCADAQVTCVPGVALAVLVADCLPVVFWSRDGGCLGVAHAGWRSLAAGILEGTVRAVRHLAQPPAGGAIGLSAWLGPCIGADAFEVGTEVIEAIQPLPQRVRSLLHAGGDGSRCLLDLRGVAADRLRHLGVTVAADTACTWGEPNRFWSWRRDHAGGRMAALIWREAGTGT